MDANMNSKQPEDINDKSRTAAAANGEKVKQLKQFIYMVDLFNVMENESK